MLPYSYEESISLLVCDPIFRSCEVWFTALLENEIVK